MGGGLHIYIYICISIYIYMHINEKKNIYIYIYLFIYLCIYSLFGVSKGGGGVSKGPYYDSFSTGFRANLGSLLHSLKRCKAGRRPLFVRCALNPKP